MHFARPSLRMSASNDGRHGPGGRADVPRGRGKIRRSGLNKPQLGTDAEVEIGGVRADADIALLPPCVGDAGRVRASLHGGPR